MSFSKLASNLPASICLEFVEALKSGNWKDGSNMTTSQKEICAEALSLWIQQSSAELSDSKRPGGEDRAKFSYHWLMQGQKPDKMQ